MGKKQKKPKISKIKRNNQKRTKLSKQGKLKTRRHKPKKQSQKSTLPRPKTVEEEESDYGEDLIDMVEEDDLNFLQKAISNKSYNLLKHIRLNEVDKTKMEEKEKNGNEKKRKKVMNDETIEELYENKISTIMEEKLGKSVRMLLPIKTKSGFVKKHVIENNKK